MIEQIVDDPSDLGMLYDSGLYGPLDFVPPAERRPHCLVLEITRGCQKAWTHARCTFCTGYENTPFYEKTLEEFRGDTDAVFTYLSGCGYGKRGIYSFGIFQRMFMGGGNSLLVETGKLMKAFRYAADSLFEYTGLYPRRMAIYGSVPAIIQKGVRDLCDLKYAASPNAAGLNLIYVGLETGSDQVLEYVSKGYKQKHIFKAAQIVQEAYMPTSVMVMPGLGGIKFYEQHVRETIKVLEALKPKYVTFMGINADEGSLYAQRMQKEVVAKANRPLTDFELVQQMIDIIRDSTTWETKMGCFDQKTDRVGYNPCPFGSRTIKFPDDKYDLFLELNLRKLRHIPPGFLTQAQFNLRNKMI